MDNATLISPDAGLGLASVKMIAALCLVLALIFLGLALLKRFGIASKLQGGASRLRVEDRVSLGPRKQVVVVRFLNRRLVLGVTDSSINLIAEADHEPQDGFSQTLAQEQQKTDSSTG